MSEKTNIHFRRYENLSIEDKTALQILAINIFELGQKKIAECLKRLNYLAPMKITDTTKFMRLVILRLEKQNLIVRNYNGVGCLPILQAAIVKDTVKKGIFNSLARELLQVVPMTNGYKKIGFFTSKEYARAVQIAVYSDNSLSDIDNVFNTKDKFNAESPFLSLFNHPFDPDCFSVLSPVNRLKTVEKIIVEGGLNLEKVDTALEYYFSELPENPNEIGYAPQIASTRSTYTLIDFLLFRGQLELCAKILAFHQRASAGETAACLGCVYFLSDNNDAAIECFEQSLVLLKKKTRKRSFFLSGFPCFCYLAALLQKDSPAHHYQAISNIDSAIKNNGFNTLILSLFKRIFQEKISAIETTPVHVFKMLPESQAIEMLFFILVLKWVEPKTAKHYTSYLQKIKDKFVHSSLRWAEAETCALLASMGKNAKNNAAHARKLHTECGTISLVDIVKPVEQWKRVLNQLLAIDTVFNPQKDPTKESNGTKTERLIWIFQYDEKYQTFSFTPRLQKLSKNGTWTKGRAVALKTLYHKWQDMEGVSEQDQSICRHLKEESYRNSYRYYRDVEYYFDDERALPAFVGHPLIFLDHALSQPIELVKGEPELRVQVIQGKTRLTLIPTRPDDGEDDRNIFVVRETPSRFKVIQFNKKHQWIAAALGKKGLALPKKAEPMARQAVSSLSSYINILSDMSVADDENLKEIEADPKPHVHVMPFQDGIRIELFVRPITDTGSYFKPGKGGRIVYAEVNGEKVKAVRNPDKEKSLSHDVISRCPILDDLEEKGGEWQVPDPEEALELLLQLKNSENDLTLNWPQGEKIKVYAQASFDNLQLALKKERDWFKASGSLTIDGDLSLELTKLMALLDNSTGRFVKMDDGTFLSLTHALKDRLNELKAYSSKSGNSRRFAPLAAPAIESLTDQLTSLKTDKAWKDHCKRLSMPVKKEVPGTLQARFRDYQTEGFHFLSRLHQWRAGACLADDMGLGKTLQALSVILLSAAEGPSLVIAPLSVMRNWEEESRRFAPTLNPVFFGPGDRQAFLDTVAPFDLVISSYGLLQTESAKLAGVNWQTVVLDEAQAIKNKTTKRSKAAMDLSAGFRLITTGTPVENHLSELWTLFNFINPGLLGSSDHFTKTFAIPIERYQDKQAAKRLKKLIQPFILRRMKSDVLTELPEKTEITLRVEMSEEETLLYEAHRLKAIEKIESVEDDAPGKKHLQILAELTRLRQLCCNPLLVMSDTTVSSSKLKVFGDLVDELLANNHKSLVFSQFVGHLAILRKFLDKKNLPYQYLDGSTSEKKRRERIKAFQSGTGDLFLISLKAGGFGLNLTAADYVIHMDPWWNPAVEDQASDRAHRIGQTRPVTVYRLVMKDTIEEKIIKLHREKRELAHSLLTGSDVAGKFSAEELLTLLRTFKE